MDKAGESFAPELGGERRMGEKGSDAFVQNAIRVLRNSVLLRSGTGGVLGALPCSQTSH